jgi:hypothetical protein
MDRQSLRRSIYRAHARYDLARRESVCTCPLTNTPLVGSEWDLHEVFVRRSGLATQHHNLIMVKENCIPVQHKAHIERGNTTRSLAQCTRRMLQVVTANKIGRWYRDLWQKHGLSVDRGLLVPQASMKVRQLVPLISVGALVSEGHVLPETGWNVEGDKGVYDIRAQVALRSQSKRRKWKERLPDEHNGYTVQQLRIWLNEGYWTQYMLGVLGLDIASIL